MASDPRLFQRFVGNRDPNHAAMFNDLGTGTEYGQTTITLPPFADMPVFSIALNSDALSDLNDAISSGTPFMMGGRASGLSSGEFMWVNNSNTERDKALLRLHYGTPPPPVPLPAGGALLLSGLLGMAYLRRR
ncbi:MAG: VPLPA-CTERM sorting domain-containing protein [Pseudomonadota bacterium]